MLETSIGINAHVKIKISYPALFGLDPLVLHVNQSLQEDASLHYDQYLQQAHLFRDHTLEDGASQEFQYCLYPVYQNPTMISIFGYESHDKGFSRDSIRVVTRTFSQDNQDIYEVVLDDLFLSREQSRQFLLQYCESYFQAHKYGYFAFESSIWPKLKPEHLDTFVLTSEGLLLIFQNYVIRGQDDYPATLLIPYTNLAPLAKPGGLIFTIIDLLHN